VYIAKVKGTVVATQKSAKISGRKLLLVEPYTTQDQPPQMKPTGRAVVTVDTVGAGEGEFVLVTQGSSARLTDMTADMPVDAVIVGIIDKVMLGSQLIYEHSQ